MAGAANNPLMHTGVTPTPTTPGTQKSIFGRLGIRKPSILSLSSPQPPQGSTARTFSLDDLLMPLPRRKLVSKLDRISSFFTPLSLFDFLNCLNYSTHYLALNIAGKTIQRKTLELLPETIKFKLRCRYIKKIDLKSLKTASVAFVFYILNLQRKFSCCTCLPPHST